MSYGSLMQALWRVRCVSAPACVREHTHMKAWNKDWMLHLLSFSHVSLPSVYFLPPIYFFSTLWTNLSVLEDSSRQLLHFLFSPFPSSLQALPGQSIIILQGSCNAEISGQNSHFETIQSESFFFFLSWSVCFEETEERTTEKGLVVKNWETFFFL